MKKSIFLCICTLYFVFTVSGCMTTVRINGKPIGQLGATASMNRAPVPKYRNVNIPKDVVDTLPKDYALSFLQSLYGPAWWSNSCRFDTNGVKRFYKVRLPGKQPYTSLNTSFIRNGKFDVIGIFVNKSKEVWCLIDQRSIAKHQGKDINSLISKIYTALLSMGVKISRN